MTQTHRFCGRPAGLGLTAAFMLTLGAAGTTAQQPSDRLNTDAPAAGNVDKLRSMLADPNQKVRREAFDSLQKLGPRAFPATPDLLKWMLGPQGSEHSADRAGAQFALEAIGPIAAGQLIEAYKRATDEQRVSLLYVLGRIYRAGDVSIEELLLDAIAQSSNEDVRGSAISAASAFVPVKRAIPLLIKIARDAKETERMRCCAVADLGRFGTDARPALPTLLTVFNERANSSELRAYAAGALGAIGPQARSVAPTLLAEFNDRNNPAKLRASALSGLGGVGSEDEQLARLFLKTLKNTNEDPEVRRAAAASLGRSHFGQFGIPALVDIVENAPRREFEFRWTALYALAKLPPTPEAGPVLLTTIEDPQESTTLQLLALEAFTKLGAQQEEIASRLITAVQTSTLLASNPEACGVALRECAGAQTAVRALRRYADEIAQQAPGTAYAESVVRNAERAARAALGR